MKKKLMLLNKTSLTTLSLLFSYEPSTNTWASPFPIDPLQEIIEPLASFPNMRKKAFNSLQSLFMKEEKDVIQEDNFLKPKTVLLSKFIKNVSQEISSFETIENKSLSHHILFSLLAISSKTTANSFIVTPQGELIEKYSGLGLLPPVIYSISEADQKTKHHLGLRNILLCIPEFTKRKIDNEVRDYFLGLCPENMILTWLGHLERQSQESGRPFKLVSGTALGLLRRFKNMQAFMEDKPDLTHEGLFSKLYPLVHRYYQELIETYSLEKRALLLFDKENPLTFESLLPLRARLVNEEKLEGEVIFKALRKETAPYPPQEQFITNTSLQEAQEILKSINLNFIKKDYAQEQTLLAAARYFSAEIVTYAHKSWKNPKLGEKVMKGEFSSKVRPVLVSLGIDLIEDMDFSRVHRDLQEHDWQECLIALLSGEFSLDEKDPSHQSKTPLDVTMENNEYEKVNFLITNGACKVSVKTALTYFKNILPNDNTSHKAFKILETQHPELLWQRTVDTLLPNHGEGFPIQTATLSTRFLSQPLYKQAFKAKKQINEVNKTGRRNVGRIEAESYCLYIKEYPELPGLEQAVHYMAYHLIGYGTPFGELIRIGDRPYYISQGIKGDTLQEVLDKYPERLKDLDDESTWSMILLAMLIQPEDGKPDNYIVEPLSNGKYRLIAIDNDHAFGPDFERTIEGIIPHTKSVLFLLEQMNDPLSDTTCQIIKNLNAGEFLLKMLANLSTLNTAYYTLFKEEEIRKKLLSQELGSLIGVAFAPHMINRLYERIVDLQNILETQKEVSSFTYKDLLQKLQPRLARRYHAALEKYILPSSQIPPIVERFENSDWKFYKHDKANHSISSRDLKGIAQTTLNIPLKAELLKQVQKGGELGSAAARIELEQVIQETESESNLKWDIETFHSYKTDKKRYEFFDKVDFEYISISDQQAWIKAFQTIPNLHQLIIRGSTALFKKDFNLKNGFSLVNLKRLDISGSIHLKNSFMILLAEHAEVLETLIARDLKNLNFFQGYQRSFYGILPSSMIRLIFPSLINLDLSQCINLQAIKLEAPKLTCFEARGCSNLITLNLMTPQLKKLDLHQAQSITDDMLETQLVNMTQLSYLELEGYGGKFYQEFYRGFPAYSLHLLANCSKKTREELVMPLLQTFYPSAININYNHNTISEAGAKILAEVFIRKTLPPLISFELYNGMIGDVGVKVLIEALIQKDLSSFTILNLGNNNIGANGVKDLTDVFAQGYFSSLKKLSLEENNIGDSGAEALSEILIQGYLPSLENLYLSNNNISEPIGKTLIKASSQGYECNAKIICVNLHYKGFNLERKKIVKAKTLDNTLHRGHPSSSIIPKSNSKTTESARRKVNDLSKDTEKNPLKRRQNKISSQINFEKKHRGHYSSRNYKDRGEIEESSTLLERKNESSEDEYTSQSTYSERKSDSSSGREIDCLGKIESGLEVDYSLLDKDMTHILAESETEEETFIPQDFVFDAKDPSYNDWHYAGLSIDGGGIRGKIPATMMSQLEECSGKKIYELFDYVGGTSVGGILSLGSVVSDDMYNPLWSASDLEELFDKYGTHIFPPSSWIGGLYKKFSQLWTTKYTVEPLEALLQSYFKDYNLSDVLKPVVVTGLEQTSNIPVIYRSIEAQENMYNDYPMWKIARVTSAAPTYFKGMNLQNLMGSQAKVGFDGGVWCNNPSQSVYNGIVKLYENAPQKADHQNIKMVSLGTGSAPIAEFKKKSGLLRAIIPITEVPMAASPEGVHLEFKELLPKGNYYRFQPTLKDAINLDDTSNEALNILDTMAHRYDREIEELARVLGENSERRHSLAP